MINRDRTGMDEPAKKMILLGKAADSTALAEGLQCSFQCLVPQSFDELGQLLNDDSVAGVVLSADEDSTSPLLLQSHYWLNHLPDGIALVDESYQIIWHNERFLSLSRCEETAQGVDFYEAFGQPVMLGPDFCPLTECLGTGELGRCTMAVGERTWMEVRAVPVSETPVEDDPGSTCVLAVVRDSSEEVFDRQKRRAIYEAGWDLGDLSPDDILEMSVEARKELLTERIVHYASAVLEFETIEVRLLDQETGRLDPLISAGMVEDAINRNLYARAQGNGLTGYVAATRNSYLCKETQTDPLYLPGAPGARSSLTVPLLLHGETTGTLNVESTTPAAFDESDLEFLELFARQISVALNTLELLIAEKRTTANESASRLLSGVAGPVDEILSDAAWLLRNFIGHEPEACERLQSILDKSRAIKRSVQTVGAQSVPDGNSGSDQDPKTNHPLSQKRFLVVDGDEDVRTAARELLSSYGCEVECVPRGEAAFTMVRSFPYDAVLTDIRLPDMDGYACFSRVKQIEENMPVILMTGFGYDPTHSIVKARQEGLKSVLYKPFRLDQLLSALMEAVESSSDTEKPWGAE